MCESRLDRFHREIRPRMCIIIDANLAHKFLNAGDEDVVPLREWLIAGKGVIATGGKNKSELQNCSFRGVLQQFLLAGRVREFSATKIARKQGSLEALKELKSNDAHVLALAIVSGSRLLFSADFDLQQDFKCGKYIPKPKGKVYQRRSHLRLLREAPPCAAVNS